MDRAANGEHVFRFEHPTQPGQQTGGWMTTIAGKPDSSGFGRLLKVQGEMKDEAPVAASSKKGVSGFIYTMEEIEKHNTEEEVWIVVNSKVYNCTDYLEIHPGEIDSIIINAGADATEDFVAIHSAKATKMLDRYYVGNLDASSIKAEPVDVAERKTRRLTSSPSIPVARSHSHFVRRWSCLTTPTCSTLACSLTGTSSTFPPASISSSPPTSTGRRY